jgi:hypothetical protein
MQSRTIWLYPGYLTKGLKGKILWHPKVPEFEADQNDWSANGSIEVTGCIHDPWPFVEGGKEFIMEIIKQ